MLALTTFLLGLANRASLTVLSQILSLSLAQYSSVKSIPVPTKFLAQCRPPRSLLLYKYPFRSDLY